MLDSIGVSEKLLACTDRGLQSRTTARTDHRCGDSEGGLWVESVQRSLSGASRQLSRRESPGGVRWIC